MIDNRNFPLVTGGVSLITAAQWQVIYEAMRDNAVPLPNIDNPIEALRRGVRTSPYSLLDASEVYNAYLGAGIANVKLSRRLQSCPSWQRTCLPMVQLKILQLAFPNLDKNEINEIIGDFPL